MIKGDVQYLCYFGFLKRQYVGAKLKMNSLHKSENSIQNIRKILW